MAGSDERDERDQTTRADLYEILGVERGATADQIKQAYLQLALIHHPDKGGNVKKFKEIYLAYKVLSDDSKKRDYDQSLSTTFSELRDAERDRDYHVARHYVGDDGSFDQQQFLAEFEASAPDRTARAELLERVQSRPKTLEELLAERNSLAVPERGEELSLSEFNQQFNRCRRREIGSREIAPASEATGLESHHGALIGEHQTFIGSMSYPDDLAPAELYAEHQMGVRDQIEENNSQVLEDLMNRHLREREELLALPMDQFLIQHEHQLVQSELFRDQPQLLLLPNGRERAADPPADV